MSHRLQDDLKQTRPFSTLEQEAHLSVQRTEAVLGHGLAEVLKPFGITPTQYILRGAGAEGLCRNDVRDRLVARVPDVTRLLDRMEAAGLVTRERGGADRRYVHTRITEQGLGLVNQLDQPVADLHRRALGHLDPGELRTLIDLLAKARDPD
jgi:DNA-binding MarR family transcriptional regulator